MQWHEFIFSEERKYKVMRHLAFWGSWWLYFLLTFLLFQQPLFAGNIKPFYLSPGDHLPLKSFFLVLLLAFACYPLIYSIFPKFISRNWLGAVAYSILLCSLLLVAVHLLYWVVFPVVDSFGNFSKAKQKTSIYWPAVNLGLMNFAKVAATAAIIKYIKYWWLRQQESQQLEKEKINAELQLLKAQVQPDFLFKTLNSIYTHALTSSPQTSAMLLKLSDLLSYMLYECDQPLVPLETEIAMMKEYMQLEKLRHNPEPEVEVNIKGELNGKQIAPFLLLPFIENSFKHCGQMTEQSWINVDIRLEGDDFSVKLTNGITQKIVDHAYFNTRGLANVQKRLALLYPGNHDLKMAIEQEMLIVSLTITLGYCSLKVDENNSTTGLLSNEQNPTIILNYVPD